MIETKHTPGPWTASADRICGGLRIRIRAPERPLGRAKTLYSPIVAAATSDWGISDAEATASASLIAAAPELLAALTELLEVGDLRGDTDLPHPADDPLLWSARMQNAWDDARAAIARAEGRS